MSESEWWVATVNEDGEVEVIEPFDGEQEQGEWTTETTYGTHWKAVGATREQAAERATSYWSRRIN